MGDGQGSKPCGQGVQFLTGSPILKGVYMNKPEGMTELDYKCHTLDSLDIVMEICERSNHPKKERAIDAVEVSQEFLERWWEV